METPLFVSSPVSEEVPDVDSNGGGPPDDGDMVAQDAVRGEYNDLAKLFMNKGGLIWSDGKVRPFPKTTPML